MLDIGIFADMLQEEARATPPHLPVRWGPCSMPFLRPGNCFLRIRLLQDSQVLSLDCGIIHISSRRSITYFFSTFCWQRRRLCIHNLHNQCCNVWGRKGLHKGEHLVKDDSHWPNINLGIVWFVFANLWRKILGRSNLSHSLGIFCSTRGITDWSLQLSQETTVPFAAVVPSITFEIPKSPASKCVYIGLTQETRHSKIQTSSPLDSYLCITGLHHENILGFYVTSADFDVGTSVSYR